MMRSLSFRLTASYLIVILIGMGVAAVLAWLSVEQMYLDTQRANLLAQAQLVATTLKDTPQLPASVEPYQQLTNVLPGIHTHVLDEQSAVVISLPSLPSPTQ